MAITRNQGPTSSFAQNNSDLQVGDALNPLATNEDIVVMVSGVMTDNSGNIPTFVYQPESASPPDTYALLGGKSDTYFDGTFGFFLTYSVEVWKIHSSYNVHPFGVDFQAQDGFGNPINCAVISGIIATYNNLDYANMLDKSATDSSQVSTTCSTGTTASTTLANELWVNAYYSVVGLFGQPTFSSPTNSYSLIKTEYADDGVSFAFQAIGMGERIVSSTGTAGGAVTVSQAAENLGVAVALRGSSGRAIDLFPFMMG